MVGGGVHENVQARFPPGRHRDNRDAQHFRQPVGVNLHAPLLHNIHHVQGQDNGLAQLDKLQGEIEVALQGGGVCHVDEHVYLVA